MVNESDNDQGVYSIQRPELLTPFPYAYNAVNFDLSFSGAGGIK
ncbi:MAG: hypothetical protein U0165_09965 [Polyangiaceae bacterium]